MRSHEISLKLEKKIKILKLKPPVRDWPRKEAYLGHWETCMMELFCKIN